MSELQVDDNLIMDGCEYTGQLDLFSPPVSQGDFEVSKKLKAIVAECELIFEKLSRLKTEQRVECINQIRESLSAYSPFKGEPVDCVRWVKSGLVKANDYNPNSVAPVEMELLETSIRSDGYTQPIVSWKKSDDLFEVVDGFHRHRVGKESKEVSKRVNGYLPIVVINDGRQDLGDRMAATIRHNRARGKHKVDSMSEIVVELKRRKWSDARIAKELGMEPDEVLRLSQVSGLAELFKDEAFSEAWEADRDDL
jgi:ParB-like chromosome segregation protein Spo0J